MISGVSNNYINYIALAVAFVLSITLENRKYKNNICL